MACNITEKDELYLDWFDNLFLKRTKMVENGTASIDIILEETRISWSESVEKMKELGFEDQFKNNVVGMRIHAGWLMQASKTLKPKKCEIDKQMLKDYGYHTIPKRK